LGCTRCYESFKNALAPLISSIHGNVQHVEESVAASPAASAPKKGKTKPPASQDPKITALREKLREAVENEKYEEAARLRDEIHNLEGK
jgi:protein arginine kinase activator